MLWILNEMHETTNFISSNVMKNIIIKSSYFFFSLKENLQSVH